MIEPLHSGFSFVVFFIICHSPLSFSAIILLLPRPRREGACVLDLYGQMKEPQISEIQINE